MLFCVCCFASEKDASWGGEVFKGHCCNCGSSGSPIELEEWQIKSIREQASWVGKRYYPHKEDIEINRELKYARETLPIPLNRIVEPCKFCEGFNVTQMTQDGNISTIIKASSAKEALEKSRSILPLI